ncbi:MAG: hypothetical protein OXQ92_01985 [Boseongicola sp.]|nr:hypothetical protein [Boseongicola sp.]MDD9976681.1 hypothetical protein [Boseongicola sp.]
MSLVVDVPNQPNVLMRLLGTLKTLVFGTLLAMTPATAILVLGWLMRRMQFVALKSAGLEAVRPGWVLGERGSGFTARLLGGLAANVRVGLGGAFSLLLATLPFTAIWSLSWWAGWENSFGKGYEQAFVGPILGIGGVAIFCALMIWLPMALAHQAVEDRALALFEWRKVRSAVRHSGWSYVFLAFVTVFLALPIFAGRGLVTFASDLVPGFDSFTAEQAANLAGAILLVKALYLFVALVILRGWAARIYTRAVGRALNGPDKQMWTDAALSGMTPNGTRAWSLTHWMRGVLLGLVWVGLAIQIYVGQFLNHDWYVWLTHPFVFLPWAI